MALASTKAADRYSAVERSGGPVARHAPKALGDLSAHLLYPSPADLVFGRLLNQLVEFLRLVHARATYKIKPERGAVAQGESARGGENRGGSRK